MDFQTVIVAILGLIVLLVFRKNSDSKDAVTHATVDSTLAERQKNKQAELEKTNKELEKIEESMKDMTPEEIEKYWDNRK